jgi:4-aminobutyrate aminotransferase-like enzyme/Ser/Thr protein kinase RdoA (MazF antagonist)
MEEPAWARPEYTPDEARQIAADRFEIQAHHAEPLPSDRDLNYLLLNETTGRRFVLKISNSGESPDVLDLQNRMLEHLTRAGFPCPGVLSGKDGGTIARLSPGSGVTFAARVLTWLPGRQLSMVRPQGPDLLRNVGNFLGAMDRALEDFSHQAQDRGLKWDLRQARQVIEGHLEYVDDGDRRELLRDLSRRLLDQLAPLRSELRLSVIHGDGNDHNILIGDPETYGHRLPDRGPGSDEEGRRAPGVGERSVSESGPGQGTPSVCGILDFGDAGRSFTVAEAAIAAAYAMLGKGDPLAAAGSLLEGYHRAMPLREAEVEALFPLMGLRLCTSVAISAHQKRREPENDYLTVSETSAWALLRELQATNLKVPHLLFREACGLEPVPAASQVIPWLQDHGHEASPVVGRISAGDDGGGGESVVPLDLSRTPLHVFDLGLASQDFPRPPGAADASAWSALIFGRMEEQGAEAGIGRYDEVRAWYTSDIFRAPLKDPEEWRTLHIGIDLFLEPGSPVMAPFDGTVHSLARNHGDLDYGPTVILEHRVPEAFDKELVFWTLYGHLGEEVLTRLTPGQRLSAGEPFATVGDFPLNGNWAPHLHFQILTDLLGWKGDFPGVALPSQRNLWTTLCPDPNLILNIPGEPADGGAASSDTPRPGRPSRRRAHARPGLPSGVPLRDPARSVKALLEARARSLGPTLSVAYRTPLKIVRGKGQYLYDHEGQQYLDCVNNVPHVGHGHPRVVEAGQAQMAVLNTNTRYLHDSLVDYAERITATLPDPLSVVYFVCSGSEANELALRMARTHTGREDVLVVEGAYHGNTSAMVDISPYKFDGPGGRGKPSWVHQTCMPDRYRGRYRAESPESVSAPGPDRESEVAEGSHPGNVGVAYMPPSELGERYADDVRSVLQALARDGGGVSAFFCESMLGCGGQIVLPDGYLARAFRHVRDYGGICVADEVQVGFGRAGTHFWAFETQGVVPDIVTLGKPMGNGHPLAAVVTTPEIAASFNNGMEYFNTFGGNPVSCAIGMAVLDVLEEEGLQENALTVGAQLLTGLRTLKDRHTVIGDVRGLGLYLGVELVEDRVARIPAPLRAARVKERLRDHRILLSTDGPHDNVLKIKPPMVFSRENAHHLLVILDGVLAEDGIRIP